MAEVASTRRAALIVNSSSRRGRQQARQARELLRAAGVSLGASYGVRHPDRLSATVRSALDQGYELIILGGGDGSVSSAVAELVGKKALLGLLPLGTANDFARSLGIPDDLEEACATIAHGHEVAVDLGLAGETYYVNVLTMGLGAEVVKTISSRLKRVLGPLAYPLATALALRRYRPFSATLTFPEHDHQPASFDRLIQLAVGNGRFYGGGAIVAPAAQVDDGLLDVYAIELRSWRSLLGIAWSLKSGRHVKRDDVQYWRTRQVQVTTHPPLPVNVDGELFDQTPELFSVAREVLRVLVPQESAVGA